MRWSYLTLLLLLGCERPAPLPTPYQGVMEVEELNASFELSGLLRSVLVARGRQVAAGQELARLDDTMAQRQHDARIAEVEALKAELALLRAGTRGEQIRATAARLDAARALEQLADRQLDRQQELVDGGAVAPASLDAYQRQRTQARAERRALTQTLQLQRRGARREQIDALEARLAASKALLAADDERLRRHVLRAPIGATVNDVHFEAGELAAVGAAIVTLGDNQHPFVDVFVPQQQIAAVHVDAPAEVRVDALPEALSGRVEHIWSRTEFTPRYLFSEDERQNLVVRVRVRVDDPQARLPLGVPAFVTLQDAAPPELAP